MSCDKTIDRTWSMHLSWNGQQAARAQKSRFYRWGRNASAPPQISVGSWCKRHVFRITARCSIMQWPTGTSCFARHGSEIVVFAPCGGNIGHWHILRVPSTWCQIFWCRTAVGHSCSHRACLSIKPIWSSNSSARTLALPSTLEFMKFQTKRANKRHFYAVHVLESHPDVFCCLRHAVHTLLYSMLSKMCNSALRGRTLSNKIVKKTLNRPKDGHCSSWGWICVELLLLFNQTRKPRPKSFKQGCRGGGR